MHQQLCKLGLPADTPLNSSQRSACRRRHWEEQHPKADWALFSLVRSPQRLVNVQKATQQKRAAAVANRLMQLKKGEAGDHDPALVALPMTSKAQGKQKKQRRGLMRAICRRCGRMTQTIPMLQATKCILAPISPRGVHQRRALVTRLQDAVNNAELADDLKHGARTVLTIVEAVEAQLNGEAGGGAPQ